jgi:nicotinate-nucleotide--dimethylbenzimidazole phosphoribosyltransferase
MPINLPAIEPLYQPVLQAQLQSCLDCKTKPVGSLGKIETLAMQIGLIQQTCTPHFKLPQLLVFAADHGLACEGISAYPSEVTWQMVENFLSGGAAVSVLARQHQLALSVVDAGIDHSFAPRLQLLNHKIAFATVNSLHHPAMTLAQCEQAVQAGGEVVRSLPGNVVLLGEMGIGNSASAALLLARLTHTDIALCTGRGTGLDDAGLARKRAVLVRVLERHRYATEHWDVMACLGGLEIAMLAGAALQAASERRVVVVDGFIAGSALLWAAQLCPAVLDYCVWSHTSAETGHLHLLKILQVQGLLDLGLRLGEASGAALAWPLIESAALLLTEMASFGSAGVAGRS